MRTKIIFTTILCALLIFTSCSKEKELSPSSNLNEGVISSELGGNKNGRFSDTDCTQKNIGCAAEVTIEGNKKNKLIGLSGNLSGITDHFTNNQEYYEAILEPQVLEMLLDGTGYLKHLTTNNGIDYFALTEVSGNEQIYVLPLK